MNNATFHLKSKLGGITTVTTSDTETISGNIYRKKMKGTDTWFDRKVCCFLNLFEYNHCYESRGE